MCSVSVEEYLQYAEKYPVWHMKCIRSHTMKMLYRYSTRHVELRDMIGVANTIPQFFEVCRHTRRLVQETLSEKRIHAGNEAATTVIATDDSDTSSIAVMTSTGFTRAEEDEEYCVSWYRRYTRNVDVDFREDTLPCGAVNLGAKVKRDRLLDLKSSFLGSTRGGGGEGDDLWQLGEDEDNCSLFGGFFGSPEDNDDGDVNQ